MNMQLIRDSICQKNLGYTTVISNPQSPHNSPQIQWLKETKFIPRVSHRPAQLLKALD